MTQKPGSKKNDRMNRKPAEASGNDIKKSIKARCREYRLQIEIFEAKNGTGNYDAILDYLKVELKRLHALTPPDSDS